MSFLLSFLLRLICEGWAWGSSSRLQDPGSMHTDCTMLSESSVFQKSERGGINDHATKQTCKHAYKYKQESED